MILGRLSIRARLTIAFAAALFCVLALAGLFVYLRVSSGLTEALDDGLEARANDVEALLDRADDDPPELSGGLFEGEEGFAQILTPEGKVVASTLGSGAGSAIDPAQIREARSASLIVDRNVPGLDAEARVLAEPASSPRGSFVVVAGASTGDRDEALAGIAGAFAIGAPVALLLASGLGYLLATRSLAPVEKMRRRADEITLERGGERLPLPQAEDEIHRLGETLNRMLDRIEESLQRQREFVADASHELRTPLAVLRAELELADREGRSREELAAAIGSAADEVDRLSRLAEDLLVVARSDQGRLPIRRERVQVDELIARVGDRFGHRARDGRRRVLVDVPEGLEASLDSLRIEQALGNLIDNALRHGAGDVRVSARRSGEELLLDVSDSGAGFPAGFEHRAFERFTRADGGRTREGTGLGLAIVQAIAAAHGGQRAGSYRETDTDGTRAEGRRRRSPTRRRPIANGVEARVVRDTVTEDGEPVEVTDDWYAQDSRREHLVPRRGHRRVRERQGARPGRVVRGRRRRRRRPGSPCPRNPEPRHGRTARSTTRARPRTTGERHHGRLDEQVAGAVRALRPQPSS